jgi:hypothetical protein
MSYTQLKPHQDARGIRSPASALVSPLYYMHPDQICEMGGILSAIPPQLSESHCDRNCLTDDHIECPMKKIHNSMGVKENGSKER